MEFMFVCIHVLFSVKQKKGNMKKNILSLSLLESSVPTIAGLEFYRGNCRRGRTKCDSNFLLYSAIFILFTVHYYLNSDVDQIMRKSLF